MAAQWRWIFGLTVVLVSVSARADEVGWHSAGPAAPPATADAPLATLGRPRVVAEAGPDPALAAPSPRLVIRAQAPVAPVPPVPPPVAPPPPPPGALISPQEGYNCGVVPTGPAPAHPILEGGRGFCDSLHNCFGKLFQPTDGRCPFQSDHAFDTFISPVTNPFYFEDPRSLTEVRPIFIHEHTPGSTPFFSGGKVDYFGVQGRLAVTQRLSFIVSELGWFWLDPHAPSGEFERANGFSEIHLGPQFTFIRNETTGTLLAGGLQFEIPAGPDRVFQSTGNLSLTPYFSFGQFFGKNRFGAFHFLNTTGYEFGVDDRRTDRFFSSFHLDFDVLNLHRIYPLVELNYIVYPFNGGERALDFEGQDLINFGSTRIAGRNDLSIAVGARYKFTEAVQVGAAIEFPLLDTKDLMGWRLTFDLIFRY